MKVKYFSVTSDRLQRAAYYAAYDIEIARREAHSDFSGQVPLDIEEVDPSQALLLIMSGTVIRPAGLNYSDRKELANRIS